MKIETHHHIVARDNDGFVFGSVDRNSGEFFEVNRSTDAAALIRAARAATTERSELVALTLTSRRLDRALADLDDPGDVAATMRALMPEADAGGAWIVAVFDLESGRWIATAQISRGDVEGEILKIESQVKSDCLGNAVPELIVRPNWSAVEMIPEIARRRDEAASHHHDYSTWVAANKIKADAKREIGRRRKTFSREI